MNEVYSYTNDKGKTYFLHSRETRLKGSGYTRTIYFFAGSVKDDGLNIPLTAVPEGWQVAETKNGLPVLKRAE